MKGAGAIRAGGLAVALALSAAPGHAQNEQAFGTFETVVYRDRVELIWMTGIRMPYGNAELRANRAVAVVDRDEYLRQIQEVENKPRGLPQRGMAPPDPRRTLTGPLIQRRFERFLASLGNEGKDGPTRHEKLTKLFRSLYLEGQVVIIDEGVEVLSARSLMLSIPDNRVVFDQLTMRLVTEGTRGERVLILRAPNLVKQGMRSTGRNVSLSTCTAGKPHFEVFSGQIEIIERDKQFEVRTRDNNLAFSGRRTIPLPDAHFFTGEQNQFFLRGLRASYSEIEGIQVFLDLGSNMNEAGGAVHEFLTGRPASEFRGDWRAGINWIEQRGFPMDGSLTYRAGDLYEGRIAGFVLDNDRGRNLQFNRNNIDGSPVTERDRSLLRSETRIHLAENWNLDVSLFAASDPSVYDEFYTGDLHERELPETSLHLRHAENNKLFTATARTTTTNYTYGDDRALTPTFREELPVVTYDVFAERLGTVGDVDILLTSATNTGFLHHEYDPLAAMRGKDNTFRFDQEIEIAAPFLIGESVAIRPRASGRFTYYDNTNGLSTGPGGDYERWALEAGVSATTRFSRTFSWIDGGAEHSLRHSMYPSISVGHRYKVDGRPSHFFQFDEVDSLNENGLVRVGMISRFEKREGSIAKRSPLNRFDQYVRRRDPFRRALPTDVREFLYIDVAQNFFPISDRDNPGIDGTGNELGLLEFEVLWRPYEDWIPLRDLRFMIEGEHDWERSDLRTFNAAVTFVDGLGIGWGAGYREDWTRKAQIGYGVSKDVLGRWYLTGGGAYDLETKKQQAYLFQLTRHDHDWLISFSLSYSVITQETSFNVGFQPLFGGLFRPGLGSAGGLGGGSPAAVLDR